MEDMPNNLNDYIPHYRVDIEYEENDLCYHNGILSVYIMDIRTGALVWMNKDNCYQYDMFIE